MTRGHEPTLTYDGTTYRFTPAVADVLRQRGVIVPDESEAESYQLALDHTIDEVDGVSETVTRSDAPDQPRLRVFDRNGGWFGQRWGFITRKLYIFRDDKRR
jgi:hypothetical protein